MSTEQAENLEAILRQSAFPANGDVGEQRRLLRELPSAQPLPASRTAPIGPSHRCTDDNWRAGAVE